MSNKFQDDKVSISTFFHGKTVGLTGATGFIGQLLVEKLLRSCPGIKKIFLLIRTSKNRTCQERLHHIISMPVFDKLRTTQPNFASKLVALSCDLAEEKLGLNDESYAVLTSEVNVLFHCAATVKFNEHLRISYNVNTLGVRRLLKMCREIHKLQALIHVSTAYSFSNHKTIEEQVYPTGWDYDKLHDAMQLMTDDKIIKLTPKILGNRPNTYTLTKAFGEEVIVKEGIGLPICIIRPSIVGASYKEPMANSKKLSLIKQDGYDCITDRIGKNTFVKTGLLHVMFHFPYSFCNVKRDNPCIKDRLVAFGIFQRFNQVLQECRVKFSLKKLP